MAKRPPKNRRRDENVLLIDGDALFKTGYYGAKNEFNDKGEHIGGLYQFLTVVRKFLNEGFYHKVFVFWDGEFSGKLRYNLYNDYKSGRGKDYINGTIPEDKDLVIQRYKVQEYLNELFIRQFEDKIVESDDFISYICKTKKNYQKITIITNDRDLCQLVEEDVRIYLCDKKEIVTIDNYSQHFKHKCGNIVLIKTICGDESDSIKGVKGVKETTLLKLFPELSNELVDLEFILKKANKLQNERIENKKKPLKSLNNIIHSVTDGIQGNRLYEVNNLLVDLTTPLLTEDAIKEVQTLSEGNISSENRGIKNVYPLVRRDGLDRIIKDENFTDYFIPFKRLIEREKKKSLTEN